MPNVETLENLISCPKCDALYDVPSPDERLQCHRCHQVLVAPIRRAGIKMLLLALASMALMWGAVTQPFISVRRFGLENETTLIDAALSFSGPALFLAITVLALVLLLPLLRLVLDAPVADLGLVAVG